MRVRWTYVLTGTLVGVSLSAPFTLQRLLDSQGSAASVPQAVAPPAARTPVVQMAALPRPRVIGRPHVPGSVAPHVVPAQASLASVRVRSAPVAHAPADVVKHWIRRHPPAPVDSRRAPDPAPATPVAQVAPVSPQPINLNSSVAAAPAPSSPVPDVVPTPTPTVTVTVPGDDWRNEREHYVHQGDNYRHAHGRDH
jgi:hypothetical protein